MYYKGESITVEFTAKGSDGQPYDMSGYTKSVSVFTPYSFRIHPLVSDVDAYSFKFSLTPEDTNSLIAGELNILLNLTVGTTTKIVRYNPFILADPYDSTGYHSLSVDSGVCSIEIIMQ